MKREWTFGEALAAWTAGRDEVEPTPAAFRTYVSAEAFLLRLTPSNGTEATTLIQVLLHQDGERSDGLHLKALRNLLAYVATPMAEAA